MQIIDEGLHVETLQSFAKSGEDHPALIGDAIPVTISEIKNIR